MLRVKWVVGKCTLAVTKNTRRIAAAYEYSIEERVHYYDSTLYVEQGTSLLEPIYNLYKRNLTFCILSLIEVLQLCK